MLLLCCKGNRIYNKFILSHPPKRKKSEAAKEKRAKKESPLLTQKTKT